MVLKRSENEEDRRQTTRRQTLRPRKLSLFEFCDFFSEKLVGEKSKCRCLPGLSVSLAWAGRHEKNLSKTFNWGGPCKIYCRKVVNCCFCILILMSRSTRTEKEKVNFFICIFRHEVRRDRRRRILRISEPIGMDKVNLDCYFIITKITFSLIKILLKQIENWAI